MSERERLRDLLRAMRSESRAPMSQKEFSELGKLARKFKFDPEFDTDLFVSSVPTVARRAHTRSKKKPLEWWQK